LSKDAEWAVEIHDTDDTFLGDLKRSKLKGRIREAVSNIIPAITSLARFNFIWPLSQINESKK
jgi:hypothetical protein